jgi:hypothetical protein
MVVFVHVPLVRRPGVGGDKRALSLDDLVRAGEGILLALASTRPGAH